MVKIKYILIIYIFAFYLSPGYLYQTTSTFNITDVENNIWGLIYRVNLTEISV